MTSIPDPPGVQPERTALAWQRTAITATVIMVPLVLVNVRTGFWWMTVLGSVALAAACLMVVAVHRRFSQLRDESDGRKPFSPFAPMVGVAVVTGLAAMIGVVTAVALIPG